MKQQLLGLLKKRNGLWSEQPWKAWMSICVCLAPSGRCPQLYPLPESSESTVARAQQIYTWDCVVRVTAAHSLYMGQALTNMHQKRQVKCSKKVCTGLSSKSWHFRDTPGLMLLFEHWAEHQVRYLRLWLATLQMGALQG